MLLPRLAALSLAAAGAANAFKDSSPFLLFSSQPLQSDATRSTQLETADDVELVAQDNIRGCHEDHHIILSRAGLRVKDFHYMPKLQKRVQAFSDVQVYEVAEVIDGDLGGFVYTAAQSCGKRQEEDFAISPTGLLVATLEKRTRQLEELDDNIDTLLAQIIARGESYTVMIAGTSVPQYDTEDQEHPPYEMDEPYPTGFHSDLKRDLGARANSSDNTQSNLPLFEKYKFLSPALFMGLSVTILLGSILYVGITAIAGLEVSYFAFSKEMGGQGQQRGKQQ